MTQKHTLWTERYRSQTLDEYIGNDELKTTIGSWILKNDIPHLLLHGKAGTGKTTLAKLITKNIDCDVMYINASDENGIDTIRDKVKSFAST
jgi:replication factor C small subunit